MSQVVSFIDYTPAARFDEIPWTLARIEEGAADDGPWTEIDDITLDPVDPDPAVPESRNFTTANASDTPALWYRVTFIDGDGGVGQPSASVQNLGTSTAPYATRDELARILKIREPSEAQEAALDRVLVAAALGSAKGVVLGCKAMVEHLDNGKQCDAVAADVGPANHAGEGSIALAHALDIPSNPKHGGIEKHVIRYTLWPGVPAVVNGETFVLQPS